MWVAGCGWTRRRTGNMERGKHVDRATGGGAFGGALLRGAPVVSALPAAQGRNLVPAMQGFGSQWAPWWAGLSNPSRGFQGTGEVGCFQVPGPAARVAVEGRLEGPAVRIVRAANSPGREAPSDLTVEAPGPELWLVLWMAAIGLCRSPAHGPAKRLFARAPPAKSSSLQPQTSRAPPRTLPKFTVRQISASNPLASDRRPSPAASSRHGDDDAGPGTAQQVRHARLGRWLRVRRAARGDPGEPDPQGHARPEECVTTSPSRILPSRPAPVK